VATPLVTALIDTYNQERYVEQALLSVLDQGLSPSELEIVVVDDGSTDKTPAIVQKFVPRVRYLRKENGGQASAFNAAIPEAHAPTVAFLDGDDWWTSGKLQAVLKAFEENSEVAAVGHGFFEVPGDAPPQEMLVPERTCMLDLSSVDAARMADQGRTLLGTSRLAVRRDLLEKIGPIPSELIFCADTPILTFALALGGAIVLDEPLCYYRQHSENLFATTGADANRMRKKFDTFAFLLQYLPQKLAEFGVKPEVISALFESDFIELHRLDLLFGQGGRLNTFRTEMEAFRCTHKELSSGDTFFRAVVGMLTIVLPPRRFYHLRQLYARWNLRRLRAVLGRAEPRVSSTTLQRRPVLSKSARPQ
jgi:glycosyltransferase involved in cell wall biosynthesis